MTADIANAYINNYEGKALYANSDPALGEPLSVSGERKGISNSNNDP